MVKYAAVVCGLRPHPASSISGIFLVLTSFCPNSSQQFPFLPRVALKIFSYDQTSLLKQSQNLDAIWDSPGYRSCLQKFKIWVLFRLNYHWIPLKPHWIFGTTSEFYNCPNLMKMSWSRWSCKTCIKLFWKFVKILIINKNRSRISRKKYFETFRCSQNSQK